MNKKQMGVTFFFLVTLFFVLSNARIASSENEVLIILIFFLFYGFIYGLVYQIISMKSKLILGLMKITITVFLVLVIKINLFEYIIHKELSSIVFFLLVISILILITDVFYIFGFLLIKKLRNYICLIRDKNK